LKQVPSYDTSGGPCNTLGFPTCQSRHAATVWAYAIEQYPPSRIVEIGSGNGAFTIALGLITFNLATAIYSFDIHKAPDQDYDSLAEFLRISFVQRDIFSEIEPYWTVREKIGDLGVTFLLCDGGDKPREFNTFAKYLKPGDVIAAHDYSVEGGWPWSEITQEQVAETVAKENLEPFMQEYFDAVGWLVYRKRL
jgi:predicted O-methyltransferase YrrM